MCSVPSRSMLAIDLLRDFWLQCSRIWPRFRGRGARRAKVLHRFHWFWFLPGIALCSSQLPNIFSLCQRIGKTFGSLSHSSDNPVDESAELCLGTVERPEARHCVRIVEIPGVLCEADEVPDYWIGRPGATKRRTAQLPRNAFPQERRDVRGSVD